MSSEAFSYPVLAADVPPQGRTYRVEADEQDRKRLAEALEIPEVRSLSAEVTVRPISGQSFSIRGTLAASVVQIDVFTLDPVAQEVSEKIDMTLMPAE